MIFFQRCVIKFTENEKKQPTYFFIVIALPIQSLQTWLTPGEKTAYISCGVGCLVPNTNWQKFSGSCNMHSEIVALGFAGVESVTKIEFMIVSITDGVLGLSFQLSSCRKDRKILISRDCIRYRWK